MIPYLILFISITILAILSDKLYSKHKKASIAIAVFSVLALSIFAGLRDYTVGADTINTMKRFTTEIYANTFFGRLGTYRHLEYGFSFFNFLITRFTRDYHIFLFFHQLIISSIVYIIAFREKREHGTKIWLFVLSYLFLWFNTSLNIIRQSIAIFIQLFAFKFIERKEYKKYLIASAIAGLFHTSSILYAIIPPVLNMFLKKKNNAPRIIFTVLIIILSFFFIDSIFSIMASAIPALERFNAYIINEDTNLSIRNLIFKAIMCTTLLVFNSKGKKQDVNDKKVIPTDVLSALSIYDVIFYSLSGFIMYGYRLSYFFLIHNIIFIPRIEAKLTKKKDKQIFVIVTILLLIGYWINRFILSNYDKTLPYILGA